MPSLANTQALFRAAIISPKAAGPVLEIAPAGRLAIYRRHYRAALTRHICGRFPTVEWLLGATSLAALAEDYVLRAPPEAPCLAEYGGGFVDDLEASGTAGLPYLADLAELDWHLGNVAVALEHSPIAITELGAETPDSLPDLRLNLQPGLRYLSSRWPVDELVRIRLSEAAPDQLEFRPEPVALEVRGARGRFRMGRLDPSVHAFRAALAGGATLGAAMEQGVATDPAFDIPGALAALFAEGLAIRIISPTEE